MGLPKYQYLLTYRLSEIIFDLTDEFLKRFLNSIEYRRLRDQMFHAARSGKQNIVEGVGQSDISKRGEIKLLGVAKASLEELLSNYEDFLRNRRLEIWEKKDWKTKRLRHYVKRISDLSNLSNLGHLKERPILPEKLEVAANLLLSLCHMSTYNLDKQLKALDQKFLTEGVYTENLGKRRIVQRQKPL